MELKFLKLQMVSRTLNSFNRTFMELKYESFKIGYNGMTVLIVPL